MIILALAITVYLFTYESSALVIFPAILLIAGVSMEVFLERKKVEMVDDGTEFKTLKEIGFYTVLALFGIFLTGYAIQKLPMSISPLTTSPVNAMLYSVLIGVSEEQFFRGFLTDWLLTHMSNVALALISGAGIFTAYHLARYSTSVNALAYVFAGGLILGFVAYRSRRISPTMLAHAGNNAASFLQSIVMVVRQIIR
mgnify:FL=1